MPQTNEIAFNLELSNVLRTKHPRWGDRITAEQTNVLRETARQPDVVIRPPGGVPVVLETEYEPARGVEEDARKRLGSSLKYAGRPDRADHCRPGPERPEPGAAGGSEAPDRGR